METTKGKFFLNDVSTNGKDPKATITDGGTVILKTETSGYLNGLTLMFRSCNCPGKTSELYIVKFEYIGDVPDEPVYSVQPIRI